MPSIESTPAKIESMTDEELDENLKLSIQADPLNLISAHRLSIKTKDAQLIKLIPNEPQGLIFDIIKDYRRRNKPLRIWILKARQEGVSTLTEAIIYSITSQTHNINALIMADEKEHANNLFDMSKLYQEQLEKDLPFLPPALKKSNEKKLEFEGIHSQIIIATAENTEAARSHTYHLVHLSECAYFRDLPAVMTGLNQSVPDNEHTLIIGETTANGMDAFYDEWCRAVDGKTDWLAVFIPWFLMKEYSKPLQSGALYPLEGIRFTTDSTRTGFLKEEDRLRSEKSLTEEQLNWRRWAIVNKCSGDIGEFKKEYPGHWKEAFQTSGANFFDNDSMERQEERKPIHVGEIFETDLKYEFRALPEGRIKLYEIPSKGEQYIVTADASEALGQDEGSVYVLNKRTNATAAVVNGQYPPEELAHLCVMCGNYFNKALVAPENKGYGYMVCQLVYQKYGNVYRKMDTKDGLKDEKTDLGFNTNSVTRPEYLARMAENISLRAIKLYDKDLISQCNTFIINPKNKKPEAALNKQDGLVICCAIAGQVRHLYPYKFRAEAIESKKRRRYHEIVETRNGGFSFE